MNTRQNLWSLPVKEIILRNVASFYPANLIKTEFLYSFFSKILSRFYRKPFSGAAEEAATRVVLEKKAVIKNFALFTGKHLRWSLFLFKLQAFRTATLLKGDSNKGLFLWILQNF